MSEYQYYEFQAIDRPLTKDQIQELRSISGRAQITSTRFVNVYNYGDFRGDPARLVEKYFDAFLYVANWGMHKLSLRFPCRTLALEQAEIYCAGESASARAKADFVILDFLSDEEGGDWEEGEGQLSSLIPLREDIAGGDYRALYLGWLACAQNEDLDEEAVEPPCPPGLGTLSAPLTALADFLRIDSDLIEVAAAASPPFAELTSDQGEFERWVDGLDYHEKTALLVNLVKAGESQIRSQLLRRYRAAAASSGHSSAIPRPRTVRELRILAENYAEERRRKEAERKAEERARREREAAAARETYLKGLARREPETWAKVDTLISAKRAGEYEQAVQLLKDLSDLGLLSGRSTEVQTRIHQLRQQHATKTSFLRRLDEALVTSSQ